MKFYLKIALLVASMALVAPGLAAQEKLAGGILYGADWGWAVTAPSGWIMDQTTWAANNIFALFYQKDQKFGPSIPIVYVNTQKLNAATDDEMMNYIRWDHANLRKDPATTVTETNLGVTLDRKLVSYTVNYGNKQFETIAYLRFKDTCFLVILATHDKAQIAPTLPKLKEVLGSLRFMDKS